MVLHLPCPLGLRNKLLPRACSLRSEGHGLDQRGAKMHPAKSPRYWASKRRTTSGFRTGAVSRHGADRAYGARHSVAGDAALLDGTLGGIPIPCVCVYI